MNSWQLEMFSLFSKLLMSQAFATRVESLTGCGTQTPGPALALSYDTSYTDTQRALHTATNGGCTAMP